MTTVVTKEIFKSYTFAVVLIEMGAISLFNQIKIIMLLRNQMTSRVAGIILTRIRERKGRLTEISDECRINRREFNVRGLSKMSLHRLLRVVYALYMVLPKREYDEMMDEIRRVMAAYADHYDYLLLDE